MTCSEPECNNPVRAKGLCNKHYLRQWKGDKNVKPRAKRQVDGDICRNGHVIAGDNINYRLRNNGYHLLCRQCELDRSRRKNNKNRSGPEVAARDTEDLLKLRGIREEAEAVAKSIGIDLRTIRIKPRAVPLWEKFQDAREGRTDYNCYNREAEFIDYAEPPTKDEADAMCASCPLLEMCKEFAVAEQPGWGVWGGMVHGDFTKEEGE